MSSTAAPGEPGLAVVERRLGAVVDSLNAATGGQALCRIDGTGGTAKNLEGRTAALMAARRLLNKDAAAELSVLRDQWRTDEATHHQRGSSPAWLEYLEGGCAELDLLLDTTQPQHQTDPRHGTVH